MKTITLVNYDRFQTDAFDVDDETFGFDYAATKVAEVQLGNYTNDPNWPDKWRNYNDPYVDNEPDDHEVLFDGVPYDEYMGDPDAKYHGEVSKFYQKVELEKKRLLAERDQVIAERKRQEEARKAEAKEERERLKVEKEKAELVRLQEKYGVAS